MIKRLLSVLITLLAIVTANAQELSVKSMELLTMDTYASVHKRLDLNENACAAVRVSLPAKGATFSGTNKIGDISKQGADYIVFMPAGSKKMYIQHPDYHELEIVFADYGIKKLQGLATYKIIINVPQNSGPLPKQVLNIKVTPSDAAVLIDGVLVENSSVKLTVGTHKYNVVCKGYYAQEGAVEIKEEMPAKLVVELDKNHNSVNSTSSSVPESYDVDTAETADIIPIANSDKHLIYRGLELGVSPEAFLKAIEKDEDSFAEIIPGESIDDEGSFVFSDIWASKRIAVYGHCNSNRKVDKLELWVPMKAKEVEENIVYLKDIFLKRHPDSFLKDGKINGKISYFIAPLIDKDGDMTPGNILGVICIDYDNSDGEDSIHIVFFDHTNAVYMSQFFE